MIWIELIAKYGLAMAEYLWANWSNKNEPTQADWDELRKRIADNDPQRVMLRVLAANNIAPDSPRGQELLALVK